MRKFIVPITLLAACSSDDSSVETVNYVAYGTSESTVTIAWVPAAEGSTYTIERGTSEADLAPIATLAEPVHSFLDTGLARESSYLYRLTITNADGTVVEPAQRATTTDDENLITGESAPVGSPIVQTVGTAGATVVAGSISLVIPPGAAADGTLVSLQPIASPTDEVDGIGMRIESSIAFTKPVSLVFALDELEVLNAPQLAITTQTDDGMWVTQPRVIDPAAGTIAMTIPVEPAKRSARASGLLRYRDAVRVPYTFITPKQATVKTNKTQALMAYELFSDSPCDNPDYEIPCVADLDNATRPTRRRSRALENHKAGYERNWYVDSKLGGAPQVGFVTPTGAVGATFTAPASRPPGRVVHVHFTNINTRTRASDRVTYAHMRITDTGSFRVTGRYQVDNSVWPCLGATVDLTDTLQFAVTMDEAENLHVDAIANFPTGISDLRSQIFGVTFQIETEPEVYTLTGGTVTPIEGNHGFFAELTGNSTPATCSFQGQSNGTYTSDALLTDWTLLVEENQFGGLTITAQGEAEWKFTVERVED